MQEQPSATVPERIVLELTPDELALLRAALRMLRATLGREEADELREVEELLRRLPER